MKTIKELKRFLKDNKGKPICLLKHEGNYQPEEKYGEIGNIQNNCFQCYWKDKNDKYYDSWIMIPKRKNINFIENGVEFCFFKSMNTLTLIYKWS